MTRSVAGMTVALSAPAVTVFAVPVALDQRRALVRSYLDGLGELPECAAGCGWLLVVPETRWTAMSRDERTLMGQLGVRRRGGRGICTTCYHRARLVGHLETYPGAVGVKACCLRCGVTASLLGGVCADCRLVASDLGELERWAS